MPCVRPLQQRKDQIENAATGSLPSQNCGPGPTQGNHQPLLGETWGDIQSLGDLGYTYTQRAPHPQLQRQPGEFQRETLSPKTAGGIGRLWTALTERDFPLWGRWSKGRVGPWLRAAVWVPHRDFLKRGAEVWQGRGSYAHMHCDSANKEIRGKMQFIPTESSCTGRTESGMPK